MNEFPPQYITDQHSLSFPLNTMKWFVFQKLFWSTYYIQSTVQDSTKLIDTDNSMMATRGKGGGRGSKGKDGQMYGEGK